MLSSSTDLEALANAIKRIGLPSEKEEKPKIKIETLLSNHISMDDITIEPIEPSYEYTFISGKRADALYGRVIIEYERPGALSKNSQRRDSVKQIKDLIKGAAKGVPHLILMPQ